VRGNKEKKRKEKKRKEKKRKEKKRKKTHFIIKTDGVIHASFCNRQHS